MSPAQALGLLSAASFHYAAGLGVIRFVLPLAAEALVEDLFLVGALVAVPNAVAFFLDARIGGYTDRVGKKKPLLAGLVGMMVLGYLLP